MLPLQLILASTLAWSGEPNGELLEFTAKWCGPCQQVSPVISRLQREGLPIRKIDVDEERELTQKYRIKAMPTFVVVVNGREVTRQQGLKPEDHEDQLRRLCNMIPRKSDEGAALVEKPARRRNSAADALEASLGEPNPQRPKIVDKTPKAGGLFGAKVEAMPQKPAIARAQAEDRSAPAANAIPASLQASVRIRIKDKSGENLGSGTIIDSQVGQALILTCGHIFRNWDKSSVIEVDVFSGERHNTYVARKIAHDNEGDVGLISIRADDLPICRVAPPGAKFAKGAPVESVGCGGGERPTIQRQRITALNRYLGSDNIECSVVPVQGRSGGGLFTPNGDVIGVCMAADPSNREGLYAGLKTIHKLLDRCQLAHLYRPSAPAEADESIVADYVAPETDDAAADLGSPEEPSLAGDNRPQEPVELIRREAPAAARPQDLPLVEVDPQEVLDSEIVIIIRPRGNEQRQSKVVMLNRASRNFLEYLTGEVDSQNSIHETTLAARKEAARKSTPKQQVRRLETRPEAALNESLLAEETEETAQPQPYRRKRKATRK